MPTEVSLPLSNCPCKGYTEEQYVSFSKNCIDLTTNTKPSPWTTNFPVGLRVAPLQECPIGMPRIWRCFWVSGSDMNFRLPRGAHAATLLGLARPRLQISHTPPHGLGMWVLSATAIALVHLFWHFWDCQGHLFLVGLTSAWHFNANLSIHRWKLAFRQADILVSKVFHRES